jgi:hypothetical protein
VRESRFGTKGDPMTERTIDDIRAQVLWKVGYECEQFQLEASGLRAMQMLGGWFGLKRAWAACRLPYVEAQILWWAEVHTGIASDDPAKALPALEHLIALQGRHGFYMTYLAPLSAIYPEMGLGPIVTAIVRGELQDATALQHHYQQRLA